MYIFKNALRNIVRSKGRNILIGIIVLAIATSSCVALSIKQASATAREQALSDIKITARISVNREKIMNSASDKSEMAQNMQNVQALTIDELKKYAQADCVEDFYYTLTTAMNAKGKLEPVDTTGIEKSDDDDTSSDTSSSSSSSTSSTSSTVSAKSTAATAAVTVTNMSAGTTAQTGTVQLTEADDDTENSTSSEEATSSESETSSDQTQSEESVSSNQSTSSDAAPKTDGNNGMPVPPDQNGGAGGSTNNQGNGGKNMPNGKNGTAPNMPGKNGSTNGADNSGAGGAAPNANDIGGMMGGDIDRSAFEAGFMGMQGDFTVVGYSSLSAMTDFTSGTKTITSGEIFDVNSKDATCIISSELATYNNLKVGKTIKLVNPNDKDEIIKLKIVGIYTDSEASATDSTQMRGFSTSQDSANQIYMSYPRA